MATMLRFIVDNLYAERKKKWFGYIKNESDSNLFHVEYTTNIQNFVFVFRLSFFFARYFCFDNIFYTFFRTRLSTIRFRSI